MRVSEPIATGFLGICGLWMCMAAGAAELTSPSQPAVNAAIAAPYIRYSRNYAGGAHTNGAYFGGASITLAVASHTGNTSADSRLLGQIRDTLVAGHEPSSNGGYPAQHEKHVTGMFVIAKHTPRIWNDLSSAEKARIDLIMKATLIASAFTDSDNNPFIKNGSQQYTLDGDSNLDRGWNPNYREGMIGGVLVGMAYFGGPAATSAILNSYSHSQFVAQLGASNLPNAYETFNWKAANPSSNAPTGSQIETGVRNFAYFGMPLGNYIAIYEDMTEFTYSRNVNAGINDGAGINGAGKIVSGAAGLPNLGAPGMLREFDGSDSGGARSSLIYALDGYRPHVVNQLSLIVAGFWPAGDPAITRTTALENIGNTDLWYKAEKGYISYAKGKSQGTQTYDDFGVSHGYIYNRSLWDDVLKPYLDGSGGDPPPPPPPSGITAGDRISAAASTRVHGEASPTSVLTGLLPAGALGTILDGPQTVDSSEWWQAAFDNGAAGWILADDFAAAPAAESVNTAGGSWRNLAFSSQSGNFMLGFNMTAAAASIDAVTGLSASGAADYTDLAVIVRFNTAGRVDARNGGSYAAANVMTYQPGVQYRVLLTVNLANHSYSATVTPAGGSPVLIADNYAFRSDQASVDRLANLAAVALTGSHTVSGIALGPPATRPGSPNGTHTSAN